MRCRAFLPLPLALSIVGGLASCASDPPPRPHLATHRAPPVFPEPKPAPAPPGESASPAAPVVQAQPSSVDAVVASLGVEKTEIVWSPAKKSFAVIVPPKAAAGVPTRRRSKKRLSPASIAVYAPTGARLGTYRVSSAGPVQDLRYLGEDRLFYFLPPVLPARASGRRGRRGRRGLSLPPPLRYAIQPMQPGAPPIACTGRQFVFSPAGDHVAYLTGDAKRQRLFADGQAVYPRQGWTAIQGEAAWSQDGASLALIESGARHRLVVLVEYDNPTGDNSWPLPPEADDPSLHVYWAGLGKLVVGPSLTKPLFAASFHRDPPPVVTMPPEPAAFAGRGRP